MTDGLIPSFKEQRPWKDQTWADNWNNAIRNVLFRDDMLKTLMMVPRDKFNDIMAFQREYFIRDVVVDELIDTQSVRVVYAMADGGSAGFKSSMRTQLILFDIFVKENEMHTAHIDRLKYRTQLISERIKWLLTRDYMIEGNSYFFRTEFDLPNRIKGYSRYRLVLAYNYKG